MADDINKIIADALAEEEANEKVAKSRKESAEATQDQTDALNALNQASRANRQQLEDINTALSAQLASFENTNKATDQYRAAVQASVRAQRDLVQAQAEGNKPLADSLKLIIENNNAEAARLAKHKDITKAAVQVGDALLRNTEILSEHEQKLKDTEESLRRFNDTSKFKSAVALETFSSVLSAAGASTLDFSAGGMQMVQSLTQMAFNFDSASNAMEINTGLGKESVNQMRTLVSENHELAVGTEEAQKAFSALNTSYSGFIGQNNTAQNELAATVVAMERLGVSAQTSGQALDILDRSMGMTSDGARVALEDFDKLAQELSLPTGQVIEDFTKIGPKLARFGKDGKKQFEALSKQARSLGIGISEAFDIAEAFDTFEGAADLAGKLNAQLGLQLNSVEMMKAPHEERIRLLRQEFAASGQNFDQMSRRQKQAVADMLGVDVSMAAKMFGDPVEYQQAAKDQEEARERAKRLTAVQDKLAKVGDRLMVAFGPVLKGFSALAEALTMKGVPEAIGLITLLVGTFKSYLLVQKAIATVTTASAGAQGLLNASMLISNARTAISNKLAAVSSFFRMKKVAETPAVVAANAAEGAAEAGTVAPKVASANATAASGAASAAAVGPTLAFGAAVLAIGAGIYLAATGMATFVSSFAELSLAQMLGAGLGLTMMAAGFVALSFGLYKVALASGIAIAPLYAIGAAMALIGAGVSMALDGIANVVTVSTEVSASDVENVSKLLDKVVEVQIASMVASVPGLDAIANIVVGGQAGGADSGGGGNKKTIELKVNERILGDVVVDIMNSRYDLTPR